MEASERLIVALDLDDLKKVEKFVKELSPYVKIFKIGMQLFSLYHRDALKVVKDCGGEIFLDLKFCDIPNTVKKAVEVVTSFGVYFFTLHTFGGYEMLKEAKIASLKKAKELNISPPKLLGVTLLTSIDERILKKELKIKYNPKNYVVFLASLAKKANFSGVVASAREAKIIRKKFGKDFLIVTPGIRPSQKKLYDQKRTLTAKEAINSGADYLVVGRPILEAKNPKDVVKDILEEIENEKR
jgi:orotidine-5'-phosphate decarboxylase